MKIHCFIRLPPRCYGRNGFSVSDGNCIHWAVHLAQTAHLAILRIANFGFLRFCVHSKHIGWAGLDTRPAADAAIYAFDCHDLLLLRVII